MSRRQLWGVTVAALVLWSSACGGDDGGTTDGGGTGGGGGVGAPCATTADCRSGLSCEDGTCQPTGLGTLGTPCLIDAECMMDLFCGDSRTCETAGDGMDLATCTTSADCAHEWVCAQTPTAGRRCVFGGDRDVGAVCTRIDQCLAGLYCTDGMCTGVVPPPALDGGLETDAGPGEDGGIPCTTSDVCDDMSVCTNEACVRSMCVYTLIDGDEDGYASTVLGACGNDCSDTDPTVNPEHTEYMTARHAGNPPLHPGTFDWNCNGVEELEFTSIVPTCDTKLGTCVEGEGWSVMPEMCGQTAGWYRCVASSCTLMLVENREQRCR